MSDFKEELRAMSAALIREQEALESGAQRIEDLPADHPDIVSHAQQVLAHAARVLAYTERLKQLANGLDDRLT